MRRGIGYFIDGPLSPRSWKFGSVKHSSQREDADGGDGETLAIGGTKSSALMRHLLKRRCSGSSKESLQGMSGSTLASVDAKAVGLTLSQHHRPRRCSRSSRKRLSVTLPARRAMTPIPDSPNAGELTYEGAISAIEARAVEIAAQAAELRAKAAAIDEETKHVKELFSQQQHGGVRRKSRSQSVTQHAMIRRRRQRSTTKSSQMQKVLLGEEALAKVRTAVVAVHEAADTAKNARIELTPPKLMTSRADNLVTLEELVGPKPPCDWRDEWVAMVCEFHRSVNRPLKGSPPPREMSEDALEALRGGALRGTRCGARTLRTTSSRRCGTIGRRAARRSSPRRATSRRASRARCATATAATPRRRTRCATSSTSKPSSRARR